MGQNGTLAQLRHTRRNFSGYYIAWRHDTIENGQPALRSAVFSPSPNDVIIMFNWLKREPKELIERRQALSPALVDYPLYQPPDHPGPFLRRRDDQTEQDFMRYRDQYAARSDENFIYFMEQRATRVAALQGDARCRATRVSRQVRRQRQPRRHRARKRLGVVCRQLLRTREQPPG